MKKVSKETAHANKNDETKEHLIRVSTETYYVELDFTECLLYQWLIETEYVANHIRSTFGENQYTELQNDLYEIYGACKRLLINCYGWKKDDLK